MSPGWERDRLMALDADPAVVGVAAQPMWLRWAAESGRSVRHAPDYFARRADGTGVVIDVRADQRIGDQDAAVFAATARLCAYVGWEYQRVGELGLVHAANLRWLSGYRHPRFAQPELAARLGEVFAEGAPLLGGAAAAGDAVAVLLTFTTAPTSSHTTASPPTSRCRPKPVTGKGCSGLPASTSTPTT